jgi:hypothetical protein
MPWPVAARAAHRRVRLEQTANIVRRPPADDRVRAAGRMLIPKTGEEFIRLPERWPDRRGHELRDVPARPARHVRRCRTRSGSGRRTNKMTKVADTQYRGPRGHGWAGGAVDERLGSVGAVGGAAGVRVARPRTSTGSSVQPPSSGLSYRNKAERRRRSTGIVYERGAEGPNGGHVDLDSDRGRGRRPARARPRAGGCGSSATGCVTAGHGLMAARAGLWESAGPASEALTGENDRPCSRCLCTCCRQAPTWTITPQSASRRWTCYQFTPIYGPDSRPTIWNPAEWGGRIPRGEVHAAVDHIFRTCRAACGCTATAATGSPSCEHLGPASTVRTSSSSGPRKAGKRCCCTPTARADRRRTCTTKALTHDGCPITALHVANARQLAKPGDQVQPR